MRFKVDFIFQQAQLEEGGGGLKAASLHNPTFECDGGGKVGHNSNLLDGGRDFCSSVQKAVYWTWTRLLKVFQLFGRLSTRKLFIWAAKCKKKTKHDHKH